MSILSAEFFGRDRHCTTTQCFHQLARRNRHSNPNPWALTFSRRSCRFADEPQTPVDGSEFFIITHNYTHRPSKIRARSLLNVLLTGAGKAQLDTAPWLNSCSGPHITLTIRAIFANSRSNNQLKPMKRINWQFIGLRWVGAQVLAVRQIPEITPLRSDFFLPWRPIQN